MQQIKEFFQNNDQLAQHLGIELLSVSFGEARACMPIQPFHLNGVDTVHGGAIFTLADFVFAAACNSHGQISVAINVAIAFTNAATQGVLYAHAEEVSRSQKLSTYNVQVTDEKENLIASFQGTAYRKKQNLLDLTEKK
ncbi:MAG: PaaI family thioesterase [Phycisphaerae bacterium]|nr:PaaI family thioesterase [Phycisphaerae bacterium]